ncbi:hypothetical protein [Serratia liquefaciens]|uniref:hypothetical protein n=1 Tax=Serratia liquefaciens TaxID=614 RepID=UPI0021BDDBAD|nr:hypothetical protein [Serratia liquefaciens]
MVIFEPGEKPIELKASNEEGVVFVFVLGSAVPHPYPLHIGSYSVHTSAQELAVGERHITELEKKLKETGDRRTASGTIPIFRWLSLPVAQES